MEQVTQLQFEAIGTLWAIDIYQPISEDELLIIEVAVQRRIEIFDRHYSRFRPDSLVTQMATTAGSYELPGDAQELFDLYQELYQLTGGAMTPLIGQTLSDAGYDAEYSLKPKELRAPPGWEEIIEYEFPRLTLKQPALLDLGAAGKGHLVDIIGALLEEHGITRYCVDAGGDMRVRRQADQPLRIGLEHPEDPAQAVGLAELSTGSLCGSAGNRRRWGRYHHILDPRSLSSPTNIAAVWVVAGSTLLADALTTALMFVSPQQLAKRYTFEYALLTDQAELAHSPQFPGEFFTAEAE
jgi:thiamine biosynthesis lipoprotein